MGSKLGLRLIVGWRARLPGAGAAGADRGFANDMHFAPRRARDCYVALPSCHRCS